MLLVKTTMGRMKDGLIKREGGGGETIVAENNADCACVGERGDGDRVRRREKLTDGLMKT